MNAYVRIIYYFFHILHVLIKGVPRFTFFQYGGKYLLQADYFNVILTKPPFNNNIKTKTDVKINCRVYFKRKFTDYN